jgi:hypothetical protein
MLMMIVLAHVIIALTSMAYTTYTFFSPSKSKLYASYSLVALTLASGTYLVLSTHSRLLPACMSGLIYLAVVSSGLLLTSRKLARQVDYNISR